MPLDPSLRTVLVIGSGPIVIAQGAEFDYSGTQACQALREEGVRVVLCNSNPATIMTDPVSADAVYLEPLTVDFVARILRKEKPQGLLATLGGQTGLNLALQLHEAGILREEGVRLLGTPIDAIRRGEDRELFRKLMHDLGEPVPDSLVVSALGPALEFARAIGYPVVVRPAFTLGGSGGGFAHDDDELAAVLKKGLRLSPIGQCLIERSICGWKEIEYEVLRDPSGSSIAVCGMENMDPVGVHTGDSIVFAPIQTLTDRQHQRMRTAALRIAAALGIEGGCNVQMALDPSSDRYFLIEVNPRVSRSSALASKATGYPIARMAAKISLGYRLDELQNPITGCTSALFEPTLDYVVCKIPRWPFDKFRAADRRLGTQMKSTGEVMALGRSLEEALHKAVRSLDLGGLDSLELPALRGVTEPELRASLRAPADDRLLVLCEVLRRGVPVAELAELTGIDAFFLQKLERIVRTEQELAAAAGAGEAPAELLLRAKQQGFADSAIARHLGQPVRAIAARRRELGLRTIYKKVDTCAAEFPSETPYFYSTCEATPGGGEDEAERPPAGKPRVLVLGSGPIRIGQGVEFDCSCVHAVDTLRELGFEAILLNNNPETVSTDAQRSDRLYFEPLDPESVLRIVEGEQPLGLLMQFGGQTALNLAAKLRAHGLWGPDGRCPILGTALDDIDRAEDRFRFEELLMELGIPRPPGAAVFSLEEGTQAARALGFPVLVRPSYVLGGRAMQIVYQEAELVEHLGEALASCPGQPVLIDRYLMGTEVEVDALCDGESVYIPGILEHIEQAGVHSGDSIAVYPPQTLGRDAIEQIVAHTTRLGCSLRVRGLFNLQFVLFDGKAQVLEVNPRASRTVPFLSKVLGLPLAALATRLALGARLSALGLSPGLRPSAPERVAVKVPVFSFGKLRDVDSALGPEMKSTGEVMGQDGTLEKALYKGLCAAGVQVPLSGAALLTIADEDKARALPLAHELAALGFRIYATEGTGRFLRAHGLQVSQVGKLGDERASGREILELIERRAVHLIVNTPTRKSRARRDGSAIRRAAVESGVPCLTSLATAAALLRVIAAHSFSIEPLPAAARAG